MTSTQKPQRAEETSTMFGEIIKLFVGDRPHYLDGLLYDIAMRIQDVWPQLDRFERLTVETMLAWAVFLSPNNKPKAPEWKAYPLFDDAHARIQSSFSLRNPLAADISKTTETVLTAIDATLARYAEARLTSDDGSAHPRITAAVNHLKVLFPELNLSFGYIGNCDLAGRSWDDRSWMIFTKLATPSCTPGCDVSFGSHRTLQLGKLMQMVDDNLATWCLEQKRRLDAGEIRRVS